MSVVLPQLTDLAAHNPAVRLLAETASTLRGDPGYVKRPTDDLGGRFLEAEAVADPAPDALAKALDQVDVLAAADARAQAARTAPLPPSNPAAARRAAGLLREITDLPEPLRALVLDAMAAGEGWSFAGFGIRRLMLPSKGPGELQLLRIEPGRGAAPHDHEGDELTLIITGAYFDGHHDYAAGDISLAQPGFVHEPKAKPGDICYALAVAYGPPKFLGALGVALRTLRLT